MHCRFPATICVYLSRLVSPSSHQAPEPSIPLTCKDNAWVRLRAPQTRARLAAAYGEGDLGVPIQELEAWLAGLEPQAHEAGARMKTVEVDLQVCSAACTRMTAPCMLLGAVPQRYGCCMPCMLLNARVSQAQRRCLREQQCALEPPACALILHALCALDSGGDVVGSLVPGVHHGKGDADADSDFDFFLARMGARVRRADGAHGGECGARAVRARARQAEPPGSCGGRARARHRRPRQVRARARRLAARAARAAAAARGAPVA